jgi:hypothetical protein
MFSDNVSNKEEQVSESSYWNTERINELLRKVDEEGLDYKSVDNPFHDNNPELKRANVLWEYTPEEILEIKKCAQDVTYFSKYCQVMTDEGLNYIRLRDYQVSVLREYQANRFNIFLAPRQVGKSITSSIILVWYLLFNHDKNAMILANVGDTAEELMDKIKAIIKGLPFFLKPGMIVNNVMSMRFDNGCRILAKTTTKTSGIGFTIHFLYMDEFAHINANFIEAFFRSTYPTVSSSKVSRIIITSTPNGMNKFYEIYQGAITGENSFNPIRVDWWQVPGRDEAWKQKEIGNLGSEELFNQEYGNQFLSSSSLLLGSGELKKIKSNGAEYVWNEIDCLHYDEVKYENLLWHPKFNIDSADSPGKKFILSVDISGGVKGDFTVINIFKLTPLPRTIIESIQEFEDESDFFGMIQIGIYRDNEVKLEELVKIIKNLIKGVFGIDRVKVAIEMNFKGELLYEKLISDDDFYDEMFLFTKHSEGARAMKPGIKYNEKNKMKYCELLRSLIREGKILVNDKKWTIPELFTFGLNNRGTYSSQTGHDDVAMTLVNLPALFDGYDFNQMVGDLFDELESDYKDLIVSKLESGMTQDFDDLGGVNKGPSTKDGKSYGDFSKLI